MIIWGCNHRKLKIEVEVVQNVAIDCTDLITVEVGAVLASIAGIWNNNVRGKSSGDSKTDSHAQLVDGSDNCNIGYGWKEG